MTLLPLGAYLLVGREAPAFSMKPSQRCLDLIKKFEGLRCEAYPDPGTGSAPWTLGYGHTLGVRAGDTCTPEQAEAWLAEDVAGAAGIVGHWFPLVTQGQFDALVSFCMNVGPGVCGQRDGLIWLKERNGGGRGVHSTLMRLTLAGDALGAAQQFLLWDKSNGIVMPGLVARRYAERDLFLS